MPKGLEIERKFLVELPDLEALDVKRRIGLTQTYLVRGENGSQRRVRRIDENGAETFVYTEKEFVTPTVREENESEISRERYEELLKQRDLTLTPVEKTRYCFDYRRQLFELDKYPFSRRFAIMELELESVDQKIDFPDNVKLLKEVSGDARYSNAALAKAGAFPGEACADCGEER